MKPKQYVAQSVFLLASFAVAVFASDQPANQVGSSATPDLSGVVREAAKGTTLDRAILEAAARRDPAAAQQLATNLSEENKKKEGNPALKQGDITKVLLLDYDLPELHVRLAESYLSDMEQARFNEEGDVPRAEFVWQELEWLRLRGVDGNLADRVARIRKKAPPRPPDGTTNINADVITAAHKTFQSGKAMHIDYPSGKPIEFELGNDFALNMPSIPIRYLRSPEFPPHGCRVVAYMLISKDGGEPKPKAFQGGYASCALPTGMLQAACVVVGKAEVRPGTKIFVHVESLFEAPGKSGVVISNTLAIPVIAKR
jgi:hypothetical protein